MNEDGQVTNTTDGSPKAFRSEVAVGIMRVDGLYSLDSPFGRTANATTRALVYAKSATKLVLNVDASAGGAVWVELREPGSNALLMGPSQPITHSSVRAEVVWPQQVAQIGGKIGKMRNVAQLAGLPIVVRFVMEQAKLYTFGFQ